MQDFIKIVGNGRKTARDLSVEEASAAMSLIMEGPATPGQTAVFMAALRIKEESSEELAAFATTLRRYCRTIEVERENLVDLCLPYDGRSKALALTPAAACIAAAGGAALVMHGRLGSTTPPKFGLGIGDTLAALGINVMCSLENAARLLHCENIGLAFVSSDQFASHLEQLNQIRFEYGLRSFFNSIEKLLNPCNASAGIAGVFHGPVLTRVATALTAQGYQRGLAVHGPEGSIDVLTSRITKIVEFGMPESEAQTQLTWAINPADFGWRSAIEQKTCSAHAYAPNQPANPMNEAEDEQSQISAVQNADLTLRLLRNQNTPDLEEARRSAILSASLMLYAAGRVSSIKAGMDLTTDALTSGEALRRLKCWREASQHLAASTNHTTNKTLLNEEKCLK